MPNGFVFPPPPPPPPPQTAATETASRGGLTQNGRGNGQFHARGRARGRGSGFQHQRGGNRGFSGGSRPPYAGNRSSGRGMPVQQPMNQSSSTPTQSNGTDTKSGMKRSWEGASVSPKNKVPRGQAAPAVPSFGFDHLISPRPSAPSTERAPMPAKKKERAHNRLGLTPRTEEHESSEQEDESDEELQLARTLRGENGKAILQFEYKGRQTNLSNPSEIAAWIAERKKKYPTKARIDALAAEKASFKEHTKVAKEQSKRKQGGAKVRPLVAEDNIEQKTRDASKDASQGPNKALNRGTTLTDVDRIQQKADELRRQLAAAEEELASSRAKITDDVSRDTSNNLPARDKSGSGPDGRSQAFADNAFDKIEHAEAPSRSKARHPDPSVREHSHRKATEQSRNDTGVARDGPDIDVSTNADESSADELTDGESPSSNESDGSDMDSAPEERSSKHELKTDEAPDTVAKRRPCRYFFQQGTCRLGDRCLYSHEGSMTAREARAGAQETRTTPKRMTLHERLMKQQENEENEELLRYIIAFGERGYLGAVRQTSDGLG